MVGALVGHRLIERGKGAGIRLTVQGGYLLDRALELLALNDEILNSVATGVMPRPAARLPAADLPSIAVLPFQNLSDEPREDLAPGVVDGIFAGLSRIGWLAVIAQSSTLGYKDTSADVRQVGRKLDVRYVLRRFSRDRYKQMMALSRLIRDQETQLVMLDAGEVGAGLCEGE